MNTRSQSNKSEIDDLYKTAIEDNDKTKSRPYTSTPSAPPQPASKHVQFNLNESEISVISSENITDTFQLKLESTIANETIHPTNTSDNRKSFKMAQQNPFATLKYAVEAVPFFDGQNIPLRYFIEGCEEAKGMLPAEAERQFARIIRTRIVGEARRTIQDVDFDSVAQLTKFLEQIYGHAKNIYQLQGELGCIYQKNEEDVITYANRVKLIGKQILEAHKNSANANQDIKEPLEKDMCKCFIRGLKPEIEQRVARNLNVQETVADALRIERELREMTDLRQGGGASNKVPSTNRSQDTCQICRKEGHSASNCRRLTQFSPQSHNTALGTEILICQICKKRGHGADRCRFREPQTLRSVNVIRTNNIVCQLCSKPGHDAKSCRTNNQSKTSVTCQWCDKPGHLANNCWKKQNEQRDTQNKSNIVCRNCNNFGHIARDCRAKNAQNTTSRNSLFCRYCKEEGHILENCELRITNNVRRNNQGNSKGPSESGVRQGPERVTHPTASQGSQ